MSHLIKRRLLIEKDQYGYRKIDSKQEFNKIGIEYNVEYFFMQFLLETEKKITRKELRSAYLDILNL